MSSIFVRQIDECPETAWVFYTPPREFLDEIPSAFIQETRGNHTFNNI